MTEEDFKGLTVRWVIEHRTWISFLGESTVTILGIFKSEEKANQCANWIKEEDPAQASNIRVYRIFYEE